MEQQRIPAHIEVSGLIRAVNGAGGFATVLAKGENDAGTIMVICCQNGTMATAYERLPQHDGTRQWSLSRVQNIETPHDFTDWWQRRHRQDPDMWVVELDVPNGERFIEGAGTKG